jgi:hypothetical protein
MLKLVEGYAGENSVQDQEVMIESTATVLIIAVGFEQKGGVQKVPNKPTEDCKDGLQSE